MNRPLIVLIILMMLFCLSDPVLGLSEYQRGVLDGLSKGWSMAQKYDTAVGGDASPFNQAVTEYNAWIEAIFGKNESLMLQPFTQSTRSDVYSISRTNTPIHSIDSSWNQSKSLLPTPDASGLIGGIPAETYYSLGPALSNF